MVFRFVGIMDRRVMKENRIQSAEQRILGTLRPLPDYGKDVEIVYFFIHCIPEDNKLKAYTNLYNVPGRVFEVSYKHKKKMIEFFKPIDIVQFVRGDLENAVRVLAKAVLEGIVEYDYLRRKPKDFDRDAFYNDVVKKFIENGIFTEKEVEDIRNLCFRFEGS